MGLTSPLADIAKTSDVESLAALSEQIRQLNDTMLYFAAAMLEKMPRLDVNDRLVVNAGESTLGAVSSVGTLNNIGGGNAVFIPYQHSNIGALHIYDNVKVS